MDQIYQDIWNADQQGNGVPALRPGETKNEAIGYVIVDERATEVDHDHKVLADVKIPEHKMPTYKLCQDLFNNYALARKSPEFVKPEELQEELNFIDAILQTPPIQVAHDYLKSSLNLQISEQILAGMIRETWFDMGSAGSQRDASGFEHVFVGEQGSQASKIGGYHFWYKYFLDDAGRVIGAPGSDDQIEYHGTKYQGAEKPGQGILVPEVVTLSMSWDAPKGDDPDGRPVTLRKPIGGFFVGCSPEGLIALGLVRCRTRGGKIAKINGAEYQLDLHRLSDNRNSIRTFFPRFRKADLIGIDEPTVPGDVRPEPDVVDVPSASVPFRILAAMVNPENPEGGREFVQIINQSQQVASLSDWKVIAPNGTGFHFGDVVVQPGDIFKFQIPKNEGILRNKAGTIELRNAQGQLVQSCAYTTDQAAKEGAPILF